MHELREYSFIYLDNHQKLVNNLISLRGKIDLVFNLCDEGFNNDPRMELHIPSFLEMIGIPYTGSGPQCLSYCYDKSLVRGMAREMNIPVPKAFFIKPEDTIFDLMINFPVIVKPNFGDASFGITQKSVAYKIEELMNAISDIRGQFGYDKPILVEEFITGSDLSLGIIGNSPNHTWYFLYWRKIIQNYRWNYQKFVDMKQSGFLTRPIGKLSRLKLKFMKRLKN